MPILSICADRLEEVGRRKKAISYRIALQRAQLEREVDRLSHPMRSFDRVRAAGEGLAQYARVAGGPEIVLLPRFVGQEWEAAIGAR